MITINPANDICRKYTMNENSPGTPLTAGCSSSEAGGSDIVKFKKVMASRIDIGLRSDQFTQLPSKKVFLYNDPSPSSYNDWYP